MSYSFEEIGHMSVTFPDGGCESGMVCKLDTTGNAAPCLAGEKFIGVAETICGNGVGVQIHGFATVKYSGVAPVVGYGNLVANGIGGVKSDSSGNLYLIVQVNAKDKTIIMEL